MESKQTKKLDASDIANPELRRKAQLWQAYADHEKARARIGIT